MNERTTTSTDAAPAGIVADDLTGANDSAVQFARDGWQARLALSRPAPGSAVSGSVTAVVSDARAQGADTARASTAQAVSALRAAGVHHLFLKIDSTLRGSVIDQIRGAIEAWSQEHPDAVAIVCSAYPAMGRTIEDGHILVDGAGVHTTSIGTDPVTPVTTSDLSELLPGSVTLALSSDSAADNAAALERSFGEGNTIAVLDARSDADLARIAEATALLGPRAIPAGAAGLAIAMSRVWAPAQGSAEPELDAVERVVVVVSSLHDVSRTQAQHLLEAFPDEQLRSFAPTLAQALDPAGIDEWMSQQLSAEQPLPPVVVVASPTDRPAAGDVPAGGRSASELIAESLAIITDRIYAHDRVGALTLLGGEGARAVLDRLGAESVLVRDAIREGIPLGTLEGGIADGIIVVTKAGGFGIPSSVTEIVHELLGTS